jgi:hypothetical protein
MKISAAILCALFIPATSIAQEVVSTLTLDSLSFISFEGYENLSIPSGSTLRFRFGEPASDGSVPFSLSPSDVSIGEIPLWSSDGVLRYTLAAPTTGTATLTPGGIRLSFPATVVATLVRDGAENPLSYSLTLTTETTAASDATGTNTETITGERVIPGPNYVQLAGATTNKTNAFPEPGRAVCLVLSGSFDQLPNAL